MSEAIALVDPWLPAGVSFAAAAFLVLVSFFGSIISGALGLGGGVLMLAVMIPLLPPATAIAVHGCVQLGSTAGRAAMMYSHIVWSLFGTFALGSIIGALIGASVVVSLPGPILKTALALFLLWAVWGSKPAGKAEIGPLGFGLVGLGASFCTMFVGATGPLVAAFLKPERLGRYGVIATHALAMTIQHGSKVFAFGLFGFHFADWGPFLTAMIVAGLAGTWLGKLLLNRLPERTFAFLLRALITVLALKFGYDATGSLIYGDSA